jgi:hypothetical protein
MVGFISPQSSQLPPDAKTFFGSFIFLKANRRRHAGTVAKISLPSWAQNKISLNDRLIGDSNAPIFTKQRLRFYFLS